MLQEAARVEPQDGQHEGGGQPQRQVELEVVREDEGGDQGDEEPTDGAAGGD